MVRKAGGEEKKSEPIPYDTAFKTYKRESFALTLPPGLHVNKKRHNDEDFTFLKSCLEIY